MLMKEQKLKCQPLTEQETAVVLSVPTLIGSIIEIQNFSNTCNRFVIDTLNKLEDLECIAANRDENGKLLGIRLLLHNIINKVEDVESIVDESNATISSFFKDYMKSFNKEETIDE